MTTSPAVTAETATKSANENPESFIPLPEPLTPGNEVVAVVATNIPPTGFSDAQIEMVKGNKARNAKMDAVAFKTRGFYYAVMGRVNFTDTQCFPGLRGIIKHALEDAMDMAVGMKNKPDAADTQRCVPGAIDEKHPNGHYSENDYLVAIDRSNLKTDLATYMSEVVHMIHDAAFETLLNHAIVDALPDLVEHSSQVEFATGAPRVIGFIVLEGPPGSGQKLKMSNGPIEAS